jgi:hypothetical protein
MKAIVRAHRFWNDTGIDIQAGRQYALRAEGYWWDAFVRSTAAGYRDRRRRFIAFPALASPAP